MTNDFRDFFIDFASKKLDESVEPVFLLKNVLTDLE